MKKFTINPVLDMETLAWVSNDGVCEYSGLVLELKKGREIVEQNAKNDQATAKQNRSQSQDAYNRTQGLLNQSIGSSAPGSLTPAATAQLAADRDNITRTYNGLRRTTEATIGQRGLGNAPSGFAVAANNGLNTGQENAETGAFRNAQIGTERQRNFATQEEANLTGQQGSLGNQASGESTQAGVARSQMGSTLGDIVGGIAQIAPVAAALFTGGASLAGSSLFGGTNPFSKIGRGASSGIGSYGSGVGVGINPMNPVYRQ